MKEIKDYTHISIKDKNGVDYLCPVETDEKHPNPEKLDENVCFETDIPGRYAARILVREA